MTSLLGFIVQPPGALNPSRGCWLTLAAFHRVQSNPLMVLQSLAMISFLSSGTSLQPMFNVKAM
jgi:hypothetical protein